VLTEKGAAWVAAGGWTQAAEAKAEERLAGLRQAAEARITAQVQTDNLKAAETTALYNAGFWEEVAFACINCGTCTYVLPDLLVL
jgi:sulfhydrogenase subunit beta (sulfur reductase)